MSSNLISRQVSRLRFRGVACSLQSEESLQVMVEKGLLRAEAAYQERSRNQKSQPKNSAVLINIFHLCVDLVQVRLLDYYDSRESGET